MSKRMLLAVLGTAAAVGSAQATTVFEGEAFLGTGSNDSIATAQDLGALALDSSIEVYGSRLAALTGGDSADFYAITLTASATLTVSVVAPTGYLSQNDPVVGLYSAGGTQLTTDDDGGTGYNSLLTYTVAAGTYYIAVSGYDDFSFSGGGNSDWVYSLTASAAAVPEADTYAMLLAGLGALGFLARRRRAD